MQGKYFVNPPHYEKDEQFLCAIDGIITIKLIPHINRQEVYTGKPKKIKDQSSGLYINDNEPIEFNYSPVNFFDIDSISYPLMTEIETKYTVVLRAGDCMYIPSFYFYHFVAKENAIQTQNKVQNESSFK